MTPITRESVLQRLMELHPGSSTSVNVSVWSFGDVTVQLTVHPTKLPRGCWTIFAQACGGDRTTAEREEAALAEALRAAEKGLWRRPTLDDEVAAVHAG